MDAGWRFDNVIRDSWKMSSLNGSWIANDTSCSEAYWFGWNPETAIATISYTFQSNGRAILSFGNCMTQGRVVAEIENRSGQKTTSEVMAESVTEMRFYFKEGDVLEISEKDGAIIQFNSLEIVGCPPGMDLFSYLQYAIRSN